MSVPNRSSFADQMMRWCAAMKERNRQYKSGVVQHTYVSIVYGDPITGSPGQPVDTGNLRDAWRILNTEHGQRVLCDLEQAPYAQIIEDGVRSGRPLTLRSKVGGFHSVKITIAGFERLQRFEAARLPMPRA